MSSPERLFSPWHIVVPKAPSISFTPRIGSRTRSTTKRFVVPRWLQLSCTRERLRQTAPFGVPWVRHHCHWSNVKHTFSPLMLPWWRKLSPRRESRTNMFYVSWSITWFWNAITCSYKFAVGITSGHILEMSWHLLDPRRPSTNPERAREEGLIPYIPELPIQQDAIINYNQTIERLKGIHTSPSGLESTCLMIGYGLDLFVTRVAPSKTFDLLKEDFDYFLISAVLTALIVASYITKQLASRKIIKQAWK